MRKQVIKKAIYGVMAHLLHYVLPVRRGLWIFGSDSGMTYRDGSKYLLEYMISNHPDYECCFVTQSRDVYDVLKANRLPCVMNLTFSGIVKIARAECVFTTHVHADILFVHSKRNRKYIYLGHGQSMKIAYAALAKTSYREREEFRTDKPVCAWMGQLRGVLHDWVMGSITYRNYAFVVATSEFLKKWVDLDFDHQVDVKILGMPRNDVLFQPLRMAKEKWIDKLDGKFVISYMPTHRLYGRGPLTPTPFERMPEVQRWMRENGVVLLVKNHPTMLLRLDAGEYHPYESDCIKDITTLGIDPMTVVYHSDVLVTDYSSVWMDYLLLRRPIIFYAYDDFVNNDVGVHFDPFEQKAGYNCYSENELFETIKKIKQDYDAMRPSEDVVRKFHKYADGNSCERFFRELAG